MPTSLDSGKDATEMNPGVVVLDIRDTEVPVVLVAQVALEVPVVLEVLLLLCRVVLAVLADRVALVVLGGQMVLMALAVPAVQVDRSLLVVRLVLNNRLVLAVLVGQVVHNLRACLVDLKAPEVREDPAVTVDLKMTAL